MGKNLYNLLNEIETDLSEYEKVEWSMQEMEGAKRRIYKEVTGMKQKRNHDGAYDNRSSRSRRWAKAAWAAAAGVVVLGAVGMANSATAKELLGDVFGKLIQTVQGEKYEEEDTKLLTKIGEHSVAVQSELEKYQGDAGFVATVEDQGVTISVTDVYCDGYTLYYTTTLETEDEGLNQAQGIMAGMEQGGGMEVTIDGLEGDSTDSFAFHKSKDGTYVAVSDLNLMKLDNSGQEGQALGLPGKDSLILNCKITNLRGYVFDQWDEEGEYLMTGEVNGAWSFRLPVTVDRSGNQEFAIGKSDQGITIKNGVKTNAGLVLEVEFPDFRQEPYNDPFNDPDIFICDSQGNQLRWMNQKIDARADGTTLQHIMLLYDGQKELCLQVVNKNHGNGLIGEIEFQVP